MKCARMLYCKPLETRTSGSTVDRKGGVFITLEKPSKPVRKEAADAGQYTAKLYQKD